MGPKWTFEGWVYVDKAGRMVGPVSDDELKRAMGTGEVGLTDRVWTRWKDGDRLLQPALARDVYQPPASPY